MLGAGVCSVQVLSPEIFELISFDTMAVTEKRFNNLEKRLNEIAESVAAVHGANSVVQKSSTPNALLITLLSIVGVAIISYWGWIGTQVVAQGKRIDVIVAELHPDNALLDISRLDDTRFIKAFPILQKLSEQPFPAPGPTPVTLQTIAAKLGKIDSKSTEYWPTVLRFIRFASAGLSPDVPPPGPPTTIVVGNEGFGLVMPKVSHEVVLLDGGYLGDDSGVTQFDHSRIIFTDHPVRMRNVLFTDCVFDMPLSATPNQYLKDASRMLLASDLKFAKISGL
jgi:hypothetical protein